jgi:hypothetical protein
MRQDAESRALHALIDSCDEIGRRLSTAAVDDRLAASYPFLTMLAVAVCGWLMEKQGRAAVGDEDFLVMKRAVAAFYVQQIVPEALGLAAAANSPATALYALPAALFAA